MSLEMHSMVLYTEIPTSVYIDRPMLQQFWLFIETDPEFITWSSREVLGLLNMHVTYDPSDLEERGLPELAMNKLVSN